MNMMKETKRNSLQAMILTQVLLLFLQFKSTESEPAVNSIMALPGCPDSCGNISIPYPFGIGSNCSMEGFEVSCNRTNDGTSTPYLLGTYLSGFSSNYSEILHINLSMGQARINSPVSSKCYNSPATYNHWEMDFSGTPFSLAYAYNTFTVTGCNTLAYLNHFDHDTNLTLGCFSSCYSPDTINKYGSCDQSNGCCRATVPSPGTKRFSVSFDERFNNSVVSNFSGCSYAMVTDDSFSFNSTYITTENLKGIQMPMMLWWEFGNETCSGCQGNSDSCFGISFEGVLQHYSCYCLNRTYGGNPYLDGGCQDYDICADPNINTCIKPAKCHNLGRTSFECSCPFGWRHSKISTECKLNVAQIIGIVIPVGIFVIALLAFFYYKYFAKANNNEGSGGTNPTN